MGAQRALLGVVNGIYQFCGARDTVAQVGWRDVMADSLFNLAPRGYGRSSFRLSEIVQLGHVPLHVWDDTPWLPYNRAEPDSDAPHGDAVPPHGAGAGALSQDRARVR